MICNKCKELKPIEEFGIEIKKNGVEYRKKYCKDCHRKQSYEWKQRNKAQISPVISKTTIPTQNTLSTEFTPLELEIDTSSTLYRLCSTCNIKKPISDYYKKEKIRCKICQNRLRRQREIETGDGTRWQVFAKPNSYYNEAQRIELFDFMNKIGWTFTDGIWWNKKFGKEQDGKFNFKKDNITPNKPKREYYNTNGGTPKIFDLDIFVPQMIEYRAQGYSFVDIASIYGCSHTTIRRFLREYYEKRTS